MGRTAKHTSQARGLPPSGSVQICEVNGRFSFNAFFANSYAHEAFQKKLPDESSLKSPLDPEKVCINLPLFSTLGMTAESLHCEQVYSAFKMILSPEKQAHLLKDAEFGMDIHLFEYYLRSRCGWKVRFIEPSNLRGGPNSSLWCRLKTLDPFAHKVEQGENFYLSLNGELLERIHQVAVELHQSELEDLGLDILKALAPLCFNDMRTIFLVHDKRMLGIVLQEIQSLVHEHNVLTAEEGEILRHGIVPTFLPG
jgi:hypothetical protein